MFINIYRIEIRRSDMLSAALCLAAVGEVKTESGTITALIRELTHFITWHETLTIRRSEFEGVL